MDRRKNLTKTLKGQQLCQRKLQKPIASGGKFWPKNSLKSAERKAPSGPSPANTGTAMTGETIIAPVAIHLCFPPSPNSIPVPGGRVITSLSVPKASPPNQTRSSSCAERKCYAAIAILTWAMSLKMGRSLPGFATASTRPLWFWTRQNPPDS